MDTTKRPPLYRVIPRLLATTALFWIPALFLLALANRVRGDEPLWGDVGLLQAIHLFASPTLDAAAVIITGLGGPEFVIMAVTTASVVLLLIHQRRAAAFLFTAAFGTAAINVVLKHMFERTRPDLWPQIITENGYSFPSGHAMISSALAFSAILLLWQTRYRWWAIGVGTAYFILVGLSRLYLGVHYPSDVLGGWCVSLLWVLSLRYAVGRLDRRGLMRRPKS